MNTFFRTYIAVICTLVTLATPAMMQAATEVNPEYADPTSSSFRIVVCDGPAGARPEGDTKYVPCDFDGVMLQIKHLINIMIILGVLASIGMFTWAGWLYISGVPANKSKAHSIFPKIFTGFILMLSAWFIVSQILSWLTTNQAFRALLGN